MATWKKVIVSGSVAELSASVYRPQGQPLQQITNLASTTILSGSFSGSFFGTFNGASAGGNTLETTVFNGSAGQPYGTGYYTVGSPGGSESEGVWIPGTTTYSTAIDDLNQLLSALISVTPTANLTTAAHQQTFSNGTNKTATRKLSFGANGTLDATDNNNYTAVLRSTNASSYVPGGTSNLNLNGTWAADGDSTSAALESTTAVDRTDNIFHNGTLALTILLRGDTAAIANTTSGGTVAGARPIRYFNTGSLKVFVNDSATPKVTLDLSTTTAATGSVLNNVTISVGAVGNKYLNGTTTQASGDTYKYRVANSVSIANAAWQNGWNWVAIMHDRPTSDTDYTIYLYEFIKHDNEPQMIGMVTVSTIANGSAAHGAVSLTSTSTAYLSGVKYHSGTVTMTPVTSSFYVQNAYKMIHPGFTINNGTSNVTLTAKAIASGSKTSATQTATNAVVTSTPALAVPDLDATLVTPYDSDLSIQLYDDFQISSGFTNFFGFKPADSIAGSTVSVTHPFKTTQTSTAFSTGSFLLKTGTPTANTDMVEYFIDEARRLTSTYNIDTNAATLATAGTLSVWDSSTALGSSGYDGALCQPTASSTSVMDSVSQGALVYPTKGGPSANGNFNVGLGPGSNANYSSTTGTVYYLRRFFNSNVNTPTGIGFSAKGNCTIVSGTPAANTNQIKVEFRFPNRFSADGYFNILGNTDIIPNSGAGPGKIIRSYPQSTDGLSSITVNSAGLSFSSQGSSCKSILMEFGAFAGGGLSIASIACNAQSIVVRVTVPEGWTGHLTGLSFALLPNTFTGYSPTTAHFPFT
jgi:hypothetical protein